MIYVECVNKIKKLYFTKKLQNPKNTNYSYIKDKQKLLKIFHLECVNSFLFPVRIEVMAMSSVAMQIY